MPFLRRAVRSRTCVAAAKAAAAAKARLSPTKMKTAKKPTPMVSPRSAVNEAAKSSSSQKDQRAAKDKAAASEGAKGSSSQKDQSVSKAKAAASEEGKGPSDRKDHGVAKAKVASEVMARGQRGGEGKVASEEAKQGGAVTRLRKSARSHDGASTSTARSVLPTRWDDESVDDPDCVEAKRPRLSVRSPPDLKKRSGTTPGVEKTEEHEMRGQGRLRQLQRFRGTGRLDMGDGAGAGGGSWNTAGTAAQEPQASSMAPPMESERKCIKLDESFDPPKALRQPVVKERGTVYKCSVSQCPLSTRECQVGLWLFALPCKKTYAKLRADWEASIKIDPKINYPLSPRVCFRHFAKTDFVSRKQRLLGLEEYAVPTIQVPREPKEPCSYTTIFRPSSLQPSQSISSKGAVDSSAAKAGKDAVASPCSTVNSASGSTARSSRSRGPQPDASTQPESKPERKSKPEGKSDPDTATSSVLNPDASSTSAVHSEPASTRSSRSTRSTAKSSIATASKRENRTAVACQTPPSVEVRPPKAESASNDGSMQSSTKGSQSTRLLLKSSVATASKSEKRTTAARPTPPSTEVAPLEADSASSDGSMPALTRRSQSAKPPVKSSIAAASKSEKTAMAASQTPPIAEVAPLEVESASNDDSVPASAKASRSTRPPQKSSVTTASENDTTSVVAGQAPLGADVVPSKAASTSAVHSAPASTKGTRSAKLPVKFGVAGGSGKENTTVVPGQTPSIAEVAPLKAEFASGNGSVPASTKGNLSPKPQLKCSVTTASENTSVAAGQTPLSAEIVPSNTASTSAVASVPASTKGSLSAKPSPKSSVTTASENDNTSVAAGQTPLSAEVVPSKAASTSAVASVPASTKGSPSAKSPPKSSVTTGSENKNSSVAVGQAPLSAEVVPLKAASTSAVRSVLASAKVSQNAKLLPKSSILTASENDNTGVAAGQKPLSAEVVPSKAASTSAVASVPASTKDSLSAKLLPKSSIATASENDNTSAAAGQTPLSAEVVPSKAVSTPAVCSVPASTKVSHCTKPPPKSSTATASEKENTSVEAGQTPLSAEVVPSKAASTSAVHSMPASLKGSQSAKPPPKSSVTTALETENTSVVAGQAPLSADVPSKAATTSAVASVPASTKGSLSAKPPPKSSVMTGSENKNTSVAVGQAPLSAEVVPSKAASTSAVASMPASTKGSLSAKPPPMSSVMTGSEKENTTVATGQTPPSAELVPSKAMSTSAVCSVPASTKVSQSAKPPPKSSVAAESKTENTAVLAGETPASTDVAPLEAESASGINSAPASPKGSNSTKLQPESTIATVSEMGNTTVTPDETLSSATVMPPEAALDFNVSSTPSSAKCSPSTKPQLEPIIAVASGTGISPVAIGQTPLSTEVSLSKVVSTSDVGSVPASVKGSPSSGAKAIIATVSDMDNGTVVTSEIPLKTELVPSKAVLASGRGFVPASAKCSPSTKPQPKPIIAVASGTGNSIAAAGERLRIAEVVPPEGASVSNVGSVPASTKSSLSTKLQPESSVGTASQTEDSTVEAVRTPPCTAYVPRTSSPALESTPTIHTDEDSATIDCLASTVLNVGSKATAVPMSSSGEGSIPVPESKSTAATVGSSPAAGDAAIPAVDAISVLAEEAEEAMSDLTSETESALDTSPDSPATGDSSILVESGEPAAADELTAVTGNSEKREAALTSGASVVSVLSTEDSPKAVEDSESTVCAGLAEGDSLAPGGRAVSKAAPSEVPEQNDSCVQLQPRPKRRRRSSSSDSDATESLEDCSSPRMQLSRSGRRPERRRCRKSLKPAGNEGAVSFRMSQPSPEGAVSSKEPESVSTVGARLLPEVASTPTVVIKSEPGTIKSEPDTDFSCSTAANTLENPERYPSPATTLSYSSDTDLEEGVAPEVFSGRLFDPSDGSYVVEREIVGERDDFGMSAVCYRVSWAPR